LKSGAVCYFEQNSSLFVGVYSVYSLYTGLSNAIYLFTDKDT